MHLAVIAAVAIVTAVITGALVVGDSVRGSLRDLTLQRLGHIDRAAVSPRLFRDQLATELTEARGFDEHFTGAQPALLLKGSATMQADDKTRRASNLNLYGVADAFWSIGEFDPRSEPSAEGVWLTAQVADDLQAKPGDEIVLQLPLMSEVPADSPLGEKVDTIAGQRFRVAGVLPDRGLARFGMQPSQRPPRAVFVPLTELATAIDQPGKANALLVTSEQVTKPTGDDASQWLDDNYRPRLADYGIQVVEYGKTLQIESSELVLPPLVVSAADKVLADDNLQPVVTYLANTIRIGDRKVPYSTVTGVDSNALLGPLLNEQGEPLKLADDEVVLNRWAADQLEAKVGDTVTLRYYEPESTHGNLREHEPPLELKLVAIAELKTADGQPTLAADPHLTPQLKGVTDQESISDWDLPFELTERITQADEDYWDDYSTTPKAFISLTLAKQQWQTRWGSISLIRLAASEEATVSNVKHLLRNELDPKTLGMAMLPVKQQGLTAASGTTPFDGLFLGFSMFLIAAAIMLLVLLFRLAMEERAREVGLLTAVGFAPAKTARFLGIEAMVVAVTGALIGVLVGVFYAWCMVTGLKTLWVDAIVTPFLEVHVGSWSIPTGFLLGLATAGLTTWRTLRSVLKQSPRSLLAGSMQDDSSLQVSSKPRRRWPVAEAMLVAAGGMAAWGTTLSGEAQAGTFFGVGALVLTGVLLLVRRHWRRQAYGRHRATGMSLVGLAATNLARQPGRSTLTMGLVASASFLLLAISAFRLAPSEAGTGNYDWYATTDAPVHYDLGTEQGQLELAFRDDEMDRLGGCTVESLRVHGGEDASCLNLYRTAQPRVLGVRDAGRVMNNFAWSKTDWSPEAPPDLNIDLGKDDHDQPVVPVVLDLATAMYSLHLSGSVGDQLTIVDSNDQPVTLEVVGLLQNSILQGDLIVSDEHFRRMYPNESGSQLFLIREKQQPAADAMPLDTLLENRLADYGMDVENAKVRLASFLAVQNTYLTTFQSLGGLGLLLGTIGLAVVQLRNVLERRGELALMQAVGYRRRRVVWLVLLENLALVAGGLLLGALAAVLALIPQLGTYQTALPWGTAAALLAIVTLVGLLATWLATRGTLRQAILPALRGD
ncbi:FtsX-like permease family protein [Aeoliella mucimassa]|uniref:FtsX-like permease family protein n=2 Tax=Aeoliella mucimassa TaxID=2527972 RepID=A0A518AMK9_9BACT|nr:FtsX-like permease family protein [Aeoliella mucimassa]